MSGRVVEIDYVEGDRKDDLFFEFKDQDLTAFTSIKLVVRRPGQATITKDAVADDLSIGKFHFEWDAGELTAGRLEARVKLEETPGVINSFPKRFPLILLVAKSL